VNAELAEDIWSASNCAPSDIEEAFRDLLHQRHKEQETLVPARVLNLVVIIDREWRGEIANRLAKVGRYHASRTVLCSVERGRTTIDAAVSMSYEAEPTAGVPSVSTEGVEVRIGEVHLPTLDRIVDPIIVAGLMTLVWAPHGHEQGVDALDRLTDVVMTDTAEASDAHEAFARAAELAGRGDYVVDLAWLRTTPWRERLCATFDPPQWRDELRRISGVTVRHRPDSVAAAELLVGWLASRLGWSASKLVAHDDHIKGKLHGRRGDIAVDLVGEPKQSVPGLAGVTIETTSGMSLSLDRGPGGLSARRRLRDGTEQAWTLLGASRGEGGILGEGVRQALLRDPTYEPALEAARVMAG
jgi:glucose-6-phosphate dehydrogenase assembly protein OpcA